MEDSQGPLWSEKRRSDIEEALKRLDEIQKQLSQEERREEEGSPRVSAAAEAVAVEGAVKQPEKVRPARKRGWRKRLLILVRRHRSLPIVVGVVGGIVSVVLGFGTAILMLSSGSELPRSPMELFRTSGTPPVSPATLAPGGGTYAPIPTIPAVATVTPTPVRVAGAPGRSYHNPLPVGQSALATNGIRIRVIGANLDAWSVIAGMDQSNQPPPDGYRYVLIRIEAKNIVAEAESFMVAPPSFALLGSPQRVYLVAEGEAPCGLIPDELSLELEQDEVGEGNICFQIPQWEADLVLIYDILSEPPFRYWAIG